MLSLIALFVTICSEATRCADMGLATSRELPTPVESVAVGVATAGKRRRTSALQSPRSGLETAVSKDDDDGPPLVPQQFSWNFGGTEIHITGAWDGWGTKTPMHRASGGEFVALIYVPVGEHQFKYYVDDNWQCNPSLPTRTDEHGNTNNVINVTIAEREFDSDVSAFARPPPSPIESYDEHSNADFSVDPPLLPPHLATPLEYMSSHVCLNHVYSSPPENVVHRCEDVLCLSLTTRVRGKRINTIFVTTPPTEATRSIS